MARQPQRGFVDLQVNGFGGVDFSARGLTEEAFAGACRALAAWGTAAFLPTLITCPPDVAQENLAVMARVMARAEFAPLLPGFHLEGPFLSAAPGTVGAHAPGWIRPPDGAYLDRLCGWAAGRVRLLTIAAEAPGAEELCRHAVRQGIAVSLGHHLADGADLRRLAAAGATALTHLGNGVPNLLDRHRNPIWAGLACDALSAMLIADGHHLPDDVVRVALRAKGAARMIAVSDASPVAGLPPGEYTALGNRVVLEADGRLHNPDKQCLVGSSATLSCCMNHLAGLGELTEEELVRIGLWNPLALIGEDPSRFAPPRGVRTDDGIRFESVQANQA